VTDQGLLLCTDLDRTLLPNGAQAESPGARDRFTALVSDPRVTLAFVSGRDRARIERAMTNYRLPRPAFVISDVGTNIYDLRGGEWRVWEQWQEVIALDWRGYDNWRLGQLLDDFPQLRRQEISKQGHCKLSYYFPLHVEQEWLDAEIRRFLQGRGVRVNLVWSLDEPAGVGLLDVLPERASKLHALEFLRAALGIDETAMLFAGDSGNDLPVLASAIPSILVANAMSAVAAEAQAAAEAAGNRQALYLARGDFIGMNGNYSAGILEGVVHYHPELVGLFEGAGRRRDE